MTKPPKQLTMITDLGESKLIERLTKDFEIHHKTTTLSIGDDAAVIDFDSDCSVISTDLLIDGIHFNLDYTHLKQLGYKSVIVNISDIYAMNAIPKYILVSIAVSNRFSVESLEQLYQGIQLACKNYHIELIGGDTSSNHRGLQISITAIGSSKKEKIVKRSGASKGDLLVVSGDLGAACLGLLVLERENQRISKNANYQPKFEPYRYFVGRQIKPEASKSTVQILEENDIVPTSMIDISDGLSTELSHLSQASNVGFKILENKIPVHSNLIEFSSEFKLNYLDLVFNGGEDYELLFTIKQKDLPIIASIPTLSVIGGTVHHGNKNLLIKEDGTELEIKPSGWDGFKDLTKSHIQTHHDDESTNES